MDKFEIYETIATRTNGDIYLGVVGPVRTGKSTFITKFVSELVVPNIANKNNKKRTMDEMPQSGNGRAIMTMQPRFVPNEAVAIKFGGNVEANIRLVDCVGYLVDGATGHLENEKPRLVKTPWDTKDIPFEKAAEIGTSKVIKEHSTIGIVVTTDGTITDIPRVNYVKAEERVVAELKEINKPFIVVLNSTNPTQEATKKLAESLTEKYGVPVLPVNVATLNEGDILSIIERVLYEFPVKKVNVKTPGWLRALPYENSIINDIISETAKAKVEKMSDFVNLAQIFEDNTDIEKPVINAVKLGSGEIDIELFASRSLFFRTISEMCSQEIMDDFALMTYARDLSFAKQEYDKLKNALEQVYEKGYGVVVPTEKEMEFYEPEIIKRGQNSGVKLRATAPSLHIMRVDVESEVVPAVGGAEMSGELVSNMLSSFKENPLEIWNTNMFGKTLSELAHDGILTKIQTFPEEAQIKMRKTLTKITNEGKGGIICILL